MTIIVEYQCDICKEKYDNRAEAEACEAEGTFNAGKDYPAGRMWEHHHSGFVGIMAFARDVYATPTFHRRGHFGEDGGHWACRSPKYSGDSLGDQLCGSSEYFKNGEKALKHWIKWHYIDEHLNGPEFNRMVVFLRSQRITPSYYTRQGNLIILEDQS